MPMQIWGFRNEGLESLGDYIQQLPITKNSNISAKNDYIAISG